MTQGKEKTQEPFEHRPKMKQTVKNIGAQLHENSFSI